VTDPTTNARGAAAVLIAPIRFYKKVISPFMPKACRFEPTCSIYAMEAIAIHGPLKGLWLAIKRLGRCHPITWLGGSSGFDPVPPAFAREASEGCRAEARSGEGGPTTASYGSAGPDHHKHECQISHG
jgi:putative membrane protein insertion efficiency factor